MEKIKRGWWLYNGIQLAIMVAATGVFVGVQVILKKVWGLELGGWSTLPMMIVARLIYTKAGRVAKAVCRAAKLPPDGWVWRQMEKSAPDEPPLPEPPPIDRTQPPPRCWPVVAWPLRIIGAIYVVVAVAGVFERDWKSFGLGIAGAVMFLGLLALAERQVTVLQANGSGLDYGWTGRLVAWESVERGWIATRHGFNGEATSTWLCLENARGCRIFKAPIDSLPPDVRADLFAWLRASANLREPGAGA